MIRTELKVMTSLMYDVIFKIKSVSADLPTASYIHANRT